MDTNSNNSNITTSNASSIYHVPSSAASKLSIPELGRPAVMPTLRQPSFPAGLGQHFLPPLPTSTHYEPKSPYVHYHPSTTAQLPQFPMPSLPIPSSLPSSLPLPLPLPPLPSIHQSTHAQIIAPLANDISSATHPSSKILVLPPELAHAQQPITLLLGDKVFRIMPTPQQPITTQPPPPQPTTATTHLSFANPTPLSTPLPTTAISASASAASAVAPIPNPIQFPSLHMPKLETGAAVFSSTSTATSTNSAESSSSSALYTAINATHRALNEAIIGDSDALMTSITSPRLRSPLWTVSDDLSNRIAATPTKIAMPTLGGVKLEPSQLRSFQSKTKSTADSAVAAVPNTESSSPNPNRRTSTRKHKTDSWGWLVKNDTSIVGMLSDDTCYRPLLEAQRQYQCPDEECKKFFACRGSLESHYRKHTQFAYICEYCNGRYARKCNYTEHLRVHTGERPFKCDECGKAFKQRHNLKDHLRIHSGDKPFECDICHKRFTVKHNFVKHRRRCHSNVPRISLPTKS